MKAPRTLRVTAFLTAFVFTLNSSSYAGMNSAVQGDPQELLAHTKALPAITRSIQLPSGLGRIDEFFQGSSGRTVILLQDAHSIPEAQDNIRKIIDFFQKSYGVNRIGLEGASSRLDAQIFRSFPDQDRLKQVMKDYSSRGELPGGVAAAMNSQKDAIFEGVEDWRLYEEGLALYLAVMQKEPELLKALEAKSRELENAKAALYSKELLEIDRALEKFSKDHQNLAEVLKKLAVVRQPEKGSSVEMLLKELESEKGEWGKDEKKREEKYSQMTGRFTREFEAYAKAVTESLFRNEGERRLDQKSHELDLRRKLAKLELSRVEWTEVTSLKRLRKDMPQYFAFYDNAEKRDEAFLNNLSRLIGDDLRSAILVSGGFHTQGLAARLRRDNISYLVVMPGIASIPENSHYRDQMLGEVSWKNYFRVENGRINLYSAFVRAVRDQLLSRNDRGLLLKSWRDQIIRDLSEKDQIAKARDYTRFLDEISSDLRPWMAEVQQFIGGLKQLQDRGQLSEANILKLLKPATILSKFSISLAPGDSVLAGNPVPLPEARQVLRTVAVDGLLESSRSELRTGGNFEKARARTQRQLRKRLKYAGFEIEIHPRVEKPGTIDPKIFDLWDSFIAYAGIKRRTLQRVLIAAWDHKESYIRTHLHGRDVRVFLPGTDSFAPYDIPVMVLKDFSKKTGAFRAYHGFSEIKLKQQGWLEILDRKGPSFKDYVADLLTVQILEGMQAPEIARKYEKEMITRNRGYALLEQATKDQAKRIALRILGGRRPSKGDRSEARQVLRTVAVDGSWEPSRSSVRSEARSFTEFLNQYLEGRKKGEATAEIRKILAGKGSLGSASEEARRFAVSALLEFIKSRKEISYKPFSSKDSESYRFMPLSNWLGKKYSVKISDSSEDAEIQVIVRADPREIRLKMIPSPKNKKLMDFIDLLLTLDRLAEDYHRYWEGPQWSWETTFEKEVALLILPALPFSVFSYLIFPVLFKGMNSWVGYALAFLIPMAAFVAVTLFSIRKTEIPAKKIEGFIEKVQAGYFPKGIGDLILSGFSRDKKWQVFSLPEEGGKLGLPDGNIIVMEWLPDGSVVQLRLIHAAEIELARQIGNAERVPFGKAPGHSDASSVELLREMLEEAADNQLKLEPFFSEFDRSAVSLEKFIQSALEKKTTVIPDPEAEWLAEIMSLWFESPTGPTIDELKEFINHIRILRGKSPVSSKPAALAGLRKKLQKLWGKYEGRSFVARVQEASYLEQVSRALKTKWNLQTSRSEFRRSEARENLELLRKSTWPGKREKKITELIAQGKQDPELVRELAQVLFERDDRGRHHAYVGLRETLAEILAAIGTPEAIHALVKAMKDSQKTVRLKVISDLNHKEGVEGDSAVLRMAVETALKDPEEDVRRQARLLLLKASEAAIPLMLGVFKKTSPVPEQSRAAYILGLIGNARLREVGRVLRLTLEKNLDPRLNHEILQALARLGDFDGLANSLLTHPQPFVRRRAAEMLGNFELRKLPGQARELILSALTESLADRHHEVKVAAAGALEKITPQSREGRSPNLSRSEARQSIPMQSLADAQAHELGNRIIQELAPKSALENNQETIFLQHPQGRLGFSRRLAGDSGQYKYENQIFTHEQSRMFGVRGTGFRVHLERIGPLIFVVLDFSSFGNPSAILPGVGQMKKMLGEHYSKNAGNIIFTTAPYYSNPEFNHWLIKPIVAMLANAAQFQDAVVTDFGSGNGLLSRISLALGAKHVFLIESPEAVDKREDPVGETKAYLAADGWKAGDYLLLEADLSDPEIEKIYDRVGIKKKTDIGILNMGPHREYGQTNQIVMREISGWEQMRFLVNGGYSLRDQSHRKVLDETEKMLRTAGWEPLSPELNSRTRGYGSFIVASRLRAEVRAKAVKGFQEELRERVLKDKETFSKLAALLRQDAALREEMKHPANLTLARAKEDQLNDQIGGLYKALALSPGLQIQMTLDPLKYAVAIEALLQTSGPSGKRSEVREDQNEMPAVLREIETKKRSFLQAALKEEDPQKGPLFVFLEPSQGEKWKTYTASPLGNDGLPNSLVLVGAQFTEKGEPLLEGLEKILLGSLPGQIPLRPIMERIKNAVIWGNRHQKDKLVVLRWQSENEEIILDIMDEGKLPIDFSRVNKAGPDMAAGYRGQRLGYRQHYSRFIDRNYLDGALYDFPLRDESNRVIGQIVRLRFPKARAEVRMESLNSREKVEALLEEHGLLFKDDESRGSSIVQYPNDLWGFSVYSERKTDSSSMIALDFWMKRAGFESVYEIEYREPVQAQLEHYLLAIHPRSETAKSFSRPAPARKSRFRSTRRSELRQAAELFAKLKIDNQNLTPDEESLLASSVYVILTRSELMKFSEDFTDTIAGIQSEKAASYAAKTRVAMRALAAAFFEEFDLAPDKTVAIAVHLARETKDSPHHKEALQSLSKFIGDFIVNGSVNAEFQKVFEEAGILEKIRVEKRLDRAGIWDEKIQAVLPLIAGQKSLLQIFKKPVLPVGLELEGYSEDDLSQYDAKFSVLLEYLTAISAARHLTAEEFGILKQIPEDEKLMEGTPLKQQVDEIRERVLGWLQKFDSGLAEGIDLRGGKARIQMNRIRALILSAKFEARIQQAA